MGMLHPTLEKQLGFDGQVFLFELNQDLLLDKRKPVFKSLSKFPSVRRDLALLVKEEIAASEIVAAVQSTGEPTLQEVAIFDVYRGKGVEQGHKSIALSLVLQNDAQTLTDLEIDAIVNNVLETLTNRISAKLRE
jgi:phenylalanyl-tRNA synthetase beta chain